MEKTHVKPVASVIRNHRTETQRMFMKSTKAMATLMAGAAQDRQKQQQQLHQPAPQLDTRQIVHDAQSRWLRPPEICEILRNYQEMNLRTSPAPPYQPPSGSLFLFDRKTLRYFRKDGHNWRKKKDGKTVKEAHERLKVGSVNALHCYYAHGEENINFQRRSYWLLEGAYEHIVLVHYLEALQGNRTSVFRLHDHSLEGQLNMLNARQTMQTGTSYGTGSGSPEATNLSSSPTSLEADNGNSGDEAEDSQLIDMDMSRKPFSLMEQLSGTEQGQAYGASSLHLNLKPKDKLASNHIDHQILQKSQRHLNQLELEKSPPDVRSEAGIPITLNETDLDYILCTPDASDGHGVNLDFSNWSELLGTSQVIEENVDGDYWAEMLQQCNGPETCGKYIESLNEKPAVNNTIRSALSPKGLGREPQTALEAQLRNVTEEKALKTAVKGNKRHPQTSCNYIENTEPIQQVEMHTSGSNSLEQTHFKTYDSFGRWMMDDIPVNKQSSESEALMSCPFEDKTEVDTALSYQEPMLNIQMSEQKFKIIDFSPDWAYASDKTKVLVTGEYLVNFQEYRWCCMFGEYEMPAEILRTGVLCCKTPPHAPGTVPFYITCNDRTACSEIKEFDFREKSESIATTAGDTGLNSVSAEELLLRLQFVHLLSSEDTLTKNVAKDPMCNKIRSYFRRTSEEWEDIRKSIQDGLESSIQLKDRIFEVFSKFKLQEWLVRRVGQDGKGPCLYDNEGQGILHIASALGFEWAIAPILAAGVGVNFRDLHGWTALHWAAYFGREKAILSLLASKAVPELLTDPTPAHPNGQTPADIASSRGHGGIAGYLAEASLQHHLSVLTLKDANLNEIHFTNATLAGESAADLLSEERGIQQSTDDQLTLKRSLSAVRRATHAVALIQSAFRQYSFRKRQDIEAATLVDIGKLTYEQVQELMAAQKIQSAFRGHRTRKLNSAATKIQSKFRGWKGRQDFLTTRRRVIKIQAHVRGYQTRKQYSRILWSVGILEKAVLRWYRGRQGLRGFQPDECMTNDDVDDDDFLLQGRKQKELVLESAVVCVQAMVHSPEARAQYVRMRTSSEENSSNSNQDQGLQRDEDLEGENMS